MSENSTIVRPIQKYCDERKIYCRKIHGGGHQRRGIPDLLVCVAGKFLALECKLPGEKPEQLQISELLKISESGGISRVVYDKDDAIGLIEKLYYSVALPDSVISESYESDRFLKGCIAV